MSNLSTQVKALVKAKLESLVLAAVDELLTDMFGEGQGQGESVTPTNAPIVAPKAKVKPKADKAARTTDTDTDTDTGKDSYKTIDFGDKRRRVHASVVDALEPVLGGVDNALKGRLMSRASYALKLGITPERVAKFIRNKPEDELKAFGRLPSEEFCKRIP